MLLLFLYMGRIPVPNKPLYDEPFWGRFDAAHPDLADAVTVPPVCQEEPYNPGRDVSINPNENSILTPWGRAVVSHARPFGQLLAYDFSVRGLQIDFAVPQHQFIGLALVPHNSLRSA